MFESIFPPDGFLDPFFGLGPDSPWSRALRMRKTLTLVCKEWRAVALPFLYHDVVIRRVGQIAALKRTLDSTPEHYSIIRSMTLLCHVPENMISFATSSLSEMLSSCTSLASLSLGPIFAFRLDCPNCAGQASEITQTVGFKTQMARVATLEYNWIFQNGLHTPLFAENLAGAYGNLVYLKIFLSAADYVSFDVRLDSLKVLILVKAEGTTRNVDLKPLYDFWKMPHLEEIRFRPFIEYSRVPDFFVEFLKQHEHLRVLDVGCCAVASSFSDSAVSKLYPQLREVLEARPSIRRLVLPASADDCYVLNSTLLDIELDHVDVWTSLLDETLPKVVRGTGRPLKWKSVRLLDNGLTTILDLPHLLLPRQLFPDRDSPSRSRYVHDIFGMRIVETNETIVRQDQHWGRPFREGNVYALGADNFRFEEDMDVSDTTSNTEVAVSDESQEDDDTDEDDSERSSEGVSSAEVGHLLGHHEEQTAEQVTAEEILDIFSALLDD